MIYDEKEIQKLIDNLDIVQVIGEYVNLKKAGSDYKGLSPFKDEKTPSFTVSPVKNIFKDFSTQIGGNVISFYMKINDIGFIQAVEELSRKYNIPLKKNEKFQLINQKINEKQAENKEYFEIMNKAQIFFENNVEKYNEALEYMKNRDFSLENMKKFKIGFASNVRDGLFQYLVEENFPEEKIIKLGLAKRNENGEIYDSFRNRIIFPIYNIEGKIVAFGGRIIEKNTNLPKYLNSPDSPIFKKGNELFGIKYQGENVRKKGFAMLMEGYLDVLTAQKNGFENAVASLGTAFTEEQAQLLKKYTDKILISYDNDEAGKNAVIKASYILKKYDFDVKCLVMDGAEKDPDEFLRKNGKKAFIEVVKKSEEVFDFLTREASKDLNLEDISGERKFIERLKPFFSNVTNNLTKNLYLQKLATNFNINEFIVKEELKDLSKEVLKRKKRISYENWKVQCKKEKKDLNIELEEQTLTYILEFYNSEREKCEELLNKKFSYPIFNELVEKLTVINFDIMQLDKTDISEESREIITKLKLRGDNGIKDEESYFKAVYSGWLKREIDDERRKSDEKNDKIRKFKLKRILTKLENISKIDEIEKLYDEFILIRRPGYV
ncbi:DNA primase [Leptotrichia sp. oral taxon 223]|uniref:DNA primase n=1 Tax=Leptotrichia sp. oral taxon 223 TaxID=712363 RepID=UPI0015BA48C5|nr:DNA primase [Leptotrichia sp. oral taxon 223]NWO18732.1 DNA primase [Leptotrichia sp. oral taxon 223]